MPRPGPRVHPARRSRFSYLRKGAEGRGGPSGHCWPGTRCAHLERRPSKQLYDLVTNSEDTAGRVALRVHSGLMDINLTSGDEGPGSPQSRQIVREQMNPSGLRLVKGRGSGSGVHLSSGEARMIADLLDELGAAMPPPDTEQLSRRALVLSTLLWDRWRA